jgi:hypothetical protein
MKRKAVDGPTNQQLVSYFYTPSAVDKNKWTCKCGKVRTQVVNSGYSNLVNHVKTAHSNWLEDYRQGAPKEACLDNFVFLASDNALKIHGWLDWIVMERMDAFSEFLTYSLACRSIPLRSHDIGITQL